MKFKELRPQVLIGIVVLGLIAWIAMVSDLEPIAGVCVGGIVSAVTSLSMNGKKEA